MKREELRQIAELTDEQLDKIMSIHGADVEKVKAKVAALEVELKERKEASDKINTELESLKSANASGEDWKAKFEALKAEQDAKDKKAEAERILAEKNADIDKRFSECVGEKKFSHDAIKAEYRRKFEEALESDEYKGKGDADIFHALTKDDAAAFVGVTAVRLAGGRPTGTGKYSSREEIMSIKDTGTRHAEMLANAHLFPELNK